MKKKNVPASNGVSLTLLWMSGDYVHIKRVSHGQETRHLMSLTAFAHSPKDTFLDLKLHTPKQRALLDPILEQAESKKKDVTIYELPGHAGRSYVFPDGTVVGKPVYVYLKYARKVGSRYQPKGTFEEAKKLLGFAKGNPILMLTLIVSLTPPCMSWMGMSNVVVQLVGVGGEGKSTYGTVVGSVWRGPIVGEPNIAVRWNATDNKLLQQAAMHSGTCTTIDETAPALRSQRKAEVFLETLTQIVGDGGRGRLNEEVVDQWLKTFVSTSNETVFGFARVAGLDDAFQDFFGRIIDIERSGSDVVDELHGHDSIPEFCATLNTIARNNYGHIGRAFIKAILEANCDDEDWCKKYLARRCKAYKDLWSKRIGAQKDDRVHQRFAQFYAVGRLAAKLEIVDWDWEDIFDASSSGERLHRRLLQANSLDRKEGTKMKGFNVVKKFVETNVGEFYQIDLTKEVPADLQEETCLGFDNDKEILLTNAKLKEILGSDSALRRMHKDPAFSEAVVRDALAYSVKRRLGKKGRRIQVVAFKKKAFDLTD